MIPFRPCMSKRLRQRQYVLYILTVHSFCPRCCSTHWYLFSLAVFCGSTSAANSRLSSAYSWPKEQTNIIEQKQYLTRDFYFKQIRNIPGHNRVSSLKDPTVSRDDSIVVEVPSNTRPETTTTDFYNTQRLCLNVDSMSGHTVKLNLNINRIKAQPSSNQLNTNTKKHSIQLGKYKKYKIKPTIKHHPNIKNKKSKKMAKADVMFLTSEVIIEIWSWFYSSGAEYFILFSCNYTSCINADSRWI